jgi:YkoY family integral membrane protein
MNNFITVLFLVFLEGILSFDNALALAAMVRYMPAEQQKKALTYGIFGAFAFRFASLFMITSIIASPAIKAFGGGYLVALAVKHFLFSSTDGDQKVLPALSFIRVVIMVELMDIAFSIDSILASVAVSQEFWVIFTGGVLGILMMRFAASLFIGLMAKFPGLERTAYLLVGTVGLKLLGEALFNLNFESGVLHWGYVAVACLSIGTGFLCSPKSL